MVAVLWRTRLELRRRWVGTLVLMLMVGLAGSGVIAAVAGASRTSTAPERLVTEVGGPRDALVFDVGEADPEEINALPQVRSSAAFTFLLVDAVEPKGAIIAFAATDPVAGAQILEGSPPDLKDPLAAVIDQPAAQQLDLGVGDELVIGLYSAEQLESFDLAGGPDGSEVTVQVGAVVREVDDITTADPSATDQVGYASAANVYLPASFLERYGEKVGTVNTLIGFELDGGRTATRAFTDAVRALPGGDTVQFLNDEPAVNPTTQRAIDVQSLGLLLFAAALGLAAALTVGQSLARQLRADGSDSELLRAVGMTRGQRVMAPALRGAVVGLGGAVVAAVGAIAWSPLTPVGLARQVEPRPGVDVNLAVIALGAVAIAALFAARAALVGISIVRHGEVGRQRSGRATVAELAARVGSAPSVVAGLAMASGRRESATATRSALAGVATGIIALVAAGTFLASIDHLTAEPERYGWTFDAVAGSPFTGNAEELQAMFTGAPGVAEVAQSGSVGVQSGDEEFGVIGVESGRGIEVGQILDGREPLGPREIVLGRRLLDQLDKDIGDTIEVNSGAGPVNLAITGTAIVPEIGSIGDGFGDGGVVTLDTFLEVSPPENPPTLALLEYRADISLAAEEELDELAGDLLLEPVLPNAVFDIQRIRSLPVLLAALLALLAVAALVHSLVSTVRSSRRDLAMLRALGFVRRQLTATTAAMALWFVALALVIGLPLGVVVGRVAWSALDRLLGAGSAPSVPVVLLLCIVPATVAVAGLAALAPSWLAGRTRPAAALRTE